MKIEQEKTEFKPVIITLESMNELLALYAALSNIAPVKCVQAINEEYDLNLINSELNVLHEMSDITREIVKQNLK